MLSPAPLRQGDRIYLVAPSSPFDRDAFTHGLAWLSERYEVAFDESLFTQQGFLAGSDQRRLDELSRAFEDDAASAIVAARGGYGLPRIAHLLPWKSLLASPKWIVGFSDITALHIEAAALSLASIHAPMVCGLGRADDEERERWRSTLEEPLAKRRYEGLREVRGGEARGRLFGGNLCLIHAAAAAGRLEIPEGSIVFLEDIGERPYRVDRMLTGLIVGGYLERAAGIVVGDFTDCEPGPDGTSVEDVLRERLESLGIPAVMGLPVGHGPRNDALVLGANSSLDASRGTFEIGEDGPERPVK